MTPGEGKQTKPTWLNDSFLHDVIRNGENEPSLNILRSDITFDTGIGDHYASIMYKVTVRVKNSETNEDKDINILIKTLPEGETTQHVLVKGEMFTREIKMFSETLPAIRRLFDIKKCPDYVDFGAKHYYHTEDMKTLVVENLVPKGFRMANRQVGLDLDHSILVMKLLGKYHASTIALRYKTAELIESYPKHPALFNAEMFNNFVQSTLKTLSSIVLSWANGSLYSRKILDRLPTLMDDFKKMVEYDPNGYNVLIHGDLWMGNMLFRYDDVTNDVLEVKFVDFQGSCLNSPAIDLQYFIHSSPTEDVRSVHSEHLLKEYHKAFCDTLEKLGHSEKAISFESLMEEYESKALQSLISIVFILPIVNADPKDAMDLEENLKSDKGDSALQSRLTGKNVTKILKKYIPIFIEKGLL